MLHHAQYIFGASSTVDPLLNQTPTSYWNNGNVGSGATITYAFMQAVGIVNDHLETCFRHRELGPPAPRRRRP